jgi:Holliday junction resolvase RusA-like endonuclease
VFQEDGREGVTTYVLAVCPSVNKCFANSVKGRRKTRAYTSWARGELKALIAQRAKPIGVPANISITLPIKTRGDCDNRIKPVVDLLVRAGVLQDDRSDFVRSVSVSFGQVDMMHVSVTAAEG